MPDYGAQSERTLEMQDVALQRVKSGLWLTKSVASVCELGPFAGEGQVVRQVHVLLLKRLLGL